MPELETPPAAAPAAAPVTPAAEAPGAPPAAQSFDQSFVDDGLDSPPVPAAVPAAPAPGAPKPGEALVAKPGEPPAAKPENEFAPPEPKGTPGKSSDLRSWASRMGARAQKAEGELSKLKTRLTQLESQPPKQAEDTTVLAQELAAAKQRIEKYEGDLRLTQYERSEEYATKYQKPYQNAVTRAYREMGELTVTEGEEGEQTERAATKADFDEIYAMPLGQATKAARAKFGDAATVVLQHRQAIRQLAEAAYGAVEEYKTKGGEVEAQTKAQQTQQGAAMQRLFTMAVEGHAKRSPALFAERDGDKEGNELLGKGKQFAASVFGGNEGLTPQQIAFRDSMAYNRLTAYPRLVRDMKAMEAKLVEANKTIEGLRGSGPGAPKPGGAAPAAGASGDIDADFEKAMA